MPSPKASPLMLNVGRAVGYSAIVIGLILVVIRIFVLNNGVLTSGIILTTAGFSTMLVTLDVFRDHYVQGMWDGQAHMPPATRSSFMLVVGRLFSGICILAGACLIIARTVVLNNNVLTSGIILITVGVVAMLAILDSYRDFHLQRLVKEHDQKMAPEAVP